MADIQKTTKTLNLHAEFTDDDTRILTVDNPKNNLDSDSIKSFETITKTTGAIVSDKSGAPFKAFKRAVVVEKTVTTLDI